MPANLCMVSWNKVDTGASVSLMGGTITVESVKGDGTRAKIEFPLDPSAM